MFSNTHRFERRITGACRNINQNQGALIGVLQLQARGFEGVLSQQVEGATSALHPQAVADRGRYSHAHSE
ncbi:MAG: hypothetical protein WDZ65_01200 [Aquisalimonadaceae bacterium]